MAKRTKSKKHPVNPDVAGVLAPGVKLVRTLEGHQGTVLSVAFDKHGAMLASGSADKTVKLWDARSGKLLRTFEGHQGEVNSVAFDPQGDMLASGSADKTVKLWEARSGKLLRTLEEHEFPVYSVAFDPEWGMLASLGADKTARLWEPGSASSSARSQGVVGEASGAWRLIDRAGC